MENFEIRNKEAWDKIHAEKAIQAKLREEAGMEPMTELEIFCQYLEEAAMEFRAVPLTIQYLADACHSLIDATTEFWNNQNGNARLKPVSQ